MLSLILPPLLAIWGWCWAVTTGGFICLAGQAAIDGFFGRRIARTVTVFGVLALGSASLSILLFQWSDAVC